MNILSLEVKSSSDIQFKLGHSDISYLPLKMRKIVDFQGKLRKLILKYQQAI